MGNAEKSERRDAERGGGADGTSHGMGAKLLTVTAVAESVKCGRESRSSMVFNAAA